MFETVLKISGIWAKTAFHIVQFPLADIRQAVEKLDVKFFQNLPWVGPKTAKKLLLEMKDSVKTEDFVKLSMDEKIYKNLVSTLKNLWYESATVKSILQEYEWEITKDNMWEVIKRVLGKM
jgi:Holliday junction DNA helicase RuvA